MEVKETYRGWQGHFCCPCRYHLNTLLELGDTKIIVSTIGNYVGNEKIPQWIGANRYFETLVFKAVKKGKFIDIDVSEELCEFDKAYFVQDGTIEDEYFWQRQELSAEEGHREVIEKVKKYMEGKYGK